MTKAMKKSFVENRFPYEEKKFFLKEIVTRDISIECQIFQIKLSSESLRKISFKYRN